MSLIRWNHPKSHPEDSRYLLPALSTMRGEFDRLFDRLIAEPWSMTGSMLSSSEAVWMPSLDVSDTGKEIAVRVELPGVDPKDVEVSITGTHLVISGDKTEESEGRNESRYHMERRFGAFRRIIELPGAVDAKKAVAEHAHGVLTIRVPRTEEARPTQVEVKPSKEAASTARTVKVGAK